MNATSERIASIVTAAQRYIDAQGNMLDILARGGVPEVSDWAALDYAQSLYRLLVNDRSR